MKKEFDSSHPGTEDPAGMLTNAESAKAIWENENNPSRNIENTMSEKYLKLNSLP